MANRDAIVAFLDQSLNHAEIEDSSRNGLQVQGAEDVKRVGLTVDASMEAYRRAVDAGCEMLIAHHGIVWDGGITAVTGTAYAHLRFLVEHSLSLYASHLPLDLHPTYGNNAGLARVLGLRNVKPFGMYHGRTIGFMGEQAKKLSVDALARGLGLELGGPTQTLPFGPATNRRIGVVSGGAGDMVPQAVAAQLDCFITGEPSHQAHHAALEGHVNVIFCGHYHSETLGVRSLGALLAKRFRVKAVFLDVPTLV